MTWQEALPALSLAFSKFKAEEYREAASQYQVALQILFANATHEGETDAEDNVDYRSDSSSEDSRAGSLTTHSCFSWIIRCLKK